MNAVSTITSAAPQVYAAIAAVTCAMSKEGISKGRRNQQQGYNFRGIDEVYNALSPMLAEHKLCILPRMISRSQEERQTQKGGTLFYTTVEAEFDFVSAEDGSKHTVKTYGEAMDSADKSTNKAMSAAYKYAAMQTFCIPTEGDNDADATTHEVAPKQQRQPKADPAPSNAKAAKVEEPKGGWGDWGRETIAFIGRCRNIEALDEFVEAETDRLMAVRAVDKAIFVAIRKADADRREALKPDLLDDEIPY